MYGYCMYGVQMGYKFCIIENDKLKMNDYDINSSFKIKFW